MAHSSEFASPQALSTCTTIRSPVSSLKCSNTEISPFTVYSNASEIDTPCLKFFPTDSELDKTSQFRVQNKITSVVKKSPRTSNEAVLLYKYLKTSTFFQRFREENRSLRVTDALIHLSRNLKYHAYPPGAIIHRKGDKSNGRIYLIFSGKVALSTEAYQQDIQQDYSRPSRFKLDNPPGSLNNIGMEVTPKSRVLPTRVGTMTDIGLQKTLNQQLPFVSNQLKKIVKTIRLNNKNIVMMQSVSQVNRNDSKTPVNHRKEDIKLSMLKSLNKISNPSCPDGDRTVKASYSESRASLENLEVVSKQKAQRMVSDAMDTSMEIDLTQVIDLKLKREKSNSKISKSNLVLKRSNAVRTAVLDASEVHEEEEPDSVNSLDNYIERGLKRILGRGDMFGDEALKDLTYVQSSLWTDEREFTVEAVGDKECEVLSFGKEDLEMLHARYDKSNTCVLDFLIDHVPKLEKLVKHENGRQFEEMFTEETLTWHQNVTVQGEKGTKVYLLFDGLCEILKNYYSSAGETSGQNEFGAKKRAESLIKDFSKKAKSILICILKPGVFLGEEILFNGTSDYEYTVKAGSTQAKLLSIEKEILLKYFPVDILKELNKLHKEKVKHNMEIFSKKIQLQITGIKDNKPKQAEAPDSPSEKQQQKTTTFVGHMNRKATKTLALLTGKMYQTLKVTVNSETPAPTRVNMKDMTWDQRKRSEPSLYQESRLMRTLTPEMFKHTMETSQFRRTPSVMQNNSKVKENSRGFEGIEHGRKSVEVKGHKFDFGKDALGKSLLEKAKEREREDERNSVINMRAKMMKEISALSTKKFIVKNYHVPTTPRAGQENVCSNSNSMTTLTPRKMTGSLDISLKIKNIEKVEEECFSERRNTLQKVAMDKHGRAYSIVGQEGSKPLKDEARDIYPLMGVSGKPVSVKKKSCKRL